LLMPDLLAQPTDTSTTTTITTFIHPIHSRAWCSMPCYSSHQHQPMPYSATGPRSVRPPSYPVAVTSAQQLASHPAGPTGCHTQVAHAYRYVGVYLPQIHNIR
jgi:hypothetical protein